MNDGNDDWKRLVKKSAVLNPVDRIAKVLYGLILVLSVTGAVSVSNFNRGNVSELLWAAIGCNVAWGLVDAITYLMDLALNRGHSIAMIRKIKSSGNEHETKTLLINEIQSGITDLMTDKELSDLGGRIRKLPEPSKSHLILGADLLAAVQLFLLVFLCLFPVALPFALTDDPALAMRISNGIALLLLFIGGFILAGYAGFRRILTGVVYMLIGVALVAIIITLGG